MRISDWSSDVCSSDLHHHEEPREDSIANVGQRALGLLIGGGDLAHGIGGCKAGASQLVVKAAETANVRAAQRGRELAGEATQRKHANLGAVERCHGKIEECELAAAIGIFAEWILHCPAHEDRQSTRMNSSH